MSAVVSELVRRLREMHVKVRDQGNRDENQVFFRLPGMEQEQIVVLDYDPLQRTMLLEVPGVYNTQGWKPEQILTLTTLPSKYGLLPHYRVDVKSGVVSIVAVFLASEPECGWATLQRCLEDVRRMLQATVAAAAQEAKAS